MALQLPQSKVGLYVVCAMLAVINYSQILGIPTANEYALHSSSVGSFLLFICFYCN